MALRRIPILGFLLLLSACEPPPPPPALCDPSTQLTCSAGETCTLNQTCGTPRYTDNGDGTVTDDVTGLVWQQTAHSGVVRWSSTDANATAEGLCSQLTLGGYKDWRLPRLRELNSLVQLGNNPTIDATAFPNTRSGQYWSASETDWEVILYEQAWVVDFSNGSNTALDKGDYVLVRCVHGSGGTDCTCSDSWSCTDSCGNSNAAATSCHGMQCSADGSGNDTCGNPDPACPVGVPDSGMDAGF
jgi:hypothetical protein